MIISIKIDGMHCGGCVRSVQKAAEAVGGVSNVTVNLETAELKADVADPEAVEALKGAIEACGFDVAAAPV